MSEPFDAGEFEAGSSASLSISRQQYKDVSVLSAGVVALADSFADWADAVGAMLADALGVAPPPPMVAPAQVEVLRRRSMQQSRASQLAAMHAAMADNKLAAMRVPKQPTFKRDGSRLSDLGADPTEAAFERDRILAGGQAAQHAAMAGGSSGAAYFPPDADAHLSTQAARAAMYRRWAEEAKNAEEEEAKRTRGDTPPGRGGRT